MKPKHFNKAISMILVLFLSFFVTKCEKPSNKEETEKPNDRFCWVCETKIHWKEFRCGILYSNGSTFVGRQTKCDMTTEEIRAYETSQAKVTSTTEDLPSCSGWTKTLVKTSETKVTCTLKP